MREESLVFQHWLLLRLWKRHNQNYRQSCLCHTASRCDRSHRQDRLRHTKNRKPPIFRGSWAWGAGAGPGQGPGLREEASNSDCAEQSQQCNPDTGEETHETDEASGQANSFTADCSEESQQCNRDAGGEAHEIDMPSGQTTSFTASLSQIVRFAGSEELPSVGSINHYLGSCYKCYFLKTRKGCMNGAQCPFCHLCEPQHLRRRGKTDLETATSALDACPQQKLAFPKNDVHENSTSDELNVVVSLTGQSDAARRIPRPPLMPPPAHLLDAHKLRKRLWTGGFKARKVNQVESSGHSSYEEVKKRLCGGSSQAAVECTIDVSKLRYSQRTCGRCFRDGRKCSDLIHDLKSGTVDPLTADFMKLSVIEKRDRHGKLALFSIDNRRLLCLKKHQQRCKSIVMARVRVLRYSDYKEVLRFWRNSDTDTDGLDIRVRGQGQKRGTWVFVARRGKRRRNR